MRQNRSLSRGLIMVAWGLACAASTPALAQSSSHFDEATGRVLMDGEGVHLAMEASSVLKNGDLIVMSSFSQLQLNDADLRGRLLARTESIEGQGALRIGGVEADQFWYALRSDRARLAGRRVEISFWQRRQGTRLSGSVEWYFGDIDGLWDTGIPLGAQLGLRFAGSLGFQPTGRVTDDGWEEWSTGPFDFDLGGRLPAAMINLQDSALDSYSISSGNLGPGTGTAVDLDALELHDLGPAKRPTGTEGACTAASEAGCGEDGACLFGRCIDAGVALNGLPINQEYQRQMLERRNYEFATFDGSREVGRRAGALEVGMTSLGGERTARGLWLGFRSLVESLHEGHASPPFTDQSWVQPAGGACTLLAEADLEPGAPLLPLVNSLDPGSIASDQYRVGDVVVEIDHQPVGDWQAAQSGWLSSFSDPAVHPVIESAQLLDLAAYKGSVVTLHRCPPSGGGPPRCGQPQVVTVDYAALAEQSLWASVLGKGGALQVEGWDARGGWCDSRLDRIPALPEPVSDFAAIDSTTVGPVRYIIFNGFPSDGTWTRAFENAVADGPARILIDARLGYGGYSNAMTHVGGMFVSPQDLHSAVEMPSLRPLLDQDHGPGLIRCSENNSSFDFMVCGGTMVWTPSTQPDGMSQIVATSRVALLVTQDVSANDFFARYLSMRKAPTRIFGPAPTFGAYGWILSTPASPLELYGGSLQVTDTSFMADSAGDLLAFETGKGVQPQELLHQKQSDALRGIDTLLKAARRWVTQ